MNIAKPNAEKDQHIVAIVLTKGVPFYGYHVGYQTFLKIYLANPFGKQQMLELLQSEAILGERFQPYEAHLNFELQFLMDHNLFGMDWLHIDEDQPHSSPLFRLPLPDEPKSSFVYQPSSSTIHLSYSDVDSNANTVKYPVYTSKSVPQQQQSEHLPRNTYCELELDVTGMSIINRFDLKERDIHCSIEKEKLVQEKALLNLQDEAREKLVKSLQSIWKDETSRRRSRGIMDPIPSVTQTDERESSTPWVAEPHLRNLMNRMMTNKPFDCSSEMAQDFTGNINIMTIFEAVEALYPKQYQDWKQRYLMKQDEMDQKSTQKETSILIHSSNSVSSFSSGPCPPEDQTLARATTPPPSTQQRLSQFNIAATPSRYRGWGSRTGLDKSIIYSLIRDPSFHDQEEEQENEEQRADILQDQLAVDEDDYFDQLHHISSNDVAKWMEETEKLTDTSLPTTTIEYSDQPPVAYRPRKLDFLAEVQKIDSILSHQSANDSNKKRILIDIEDLGPSISDEETNEETNTLAEDDGQDLSVSDIPPDET